MCFMTADQTIPTRPLLIPFEPPGDSRTASEPDEWQGVFRPHGRILRRVRAIRRTVFLILWTLTAITIQSVLVVVPGPAKVRFARIFWWMFGRLMGLKVRCIGQKAKRGRLKDGTRARPVLFVSNHSSWLDIVCLGSTLHACFVSKDDVADWPVVKTVARLGRTIFVSRQRGSTLKERDAMTSRLENGDNLVLFPEGTTSDGSRVLPFRSAFLSLAVGPNPPLVQPVSIVYDRLASMPTGRSTRAIFAYYGATSIGAHFWRLAQWKGLRASVMLHPPLEPADFPDRKALTNAVYAAVTAGTDALKQGRVPDPPRPEKRSTP
ncbi:1-acyl-sn-glycerol-3-phosphate acyltransferase [Granulibacter bethesdensis]|nr:1-acyl-sn-glycerol-3-phosphate acyltransferase [Granulibacter bethesdensis]APH58409.1 1-acyl-sn-glycerol-3-phosphate acyltransferase [Granulibacter bethesdensis]